MSNGCEQLSHRNVANPNTENGWRYFHHTDFGCLGEYNADVLWVGGAFISDYDSWFKYKALFGDHKRIVIQWVGSDTLYAKRFWESGQRTLFKEFHSDRFLHIPGSEGLKGELKEWFGLDSTEPMDIPAEKVFQELPKPKQYTVGFYLPPNSADKYNYFVMEELCKKYPDRDYRVIFYHWLPLFHELSLAGPYGTRFGINREEYEQVVADCSVLVRIPDHDAVSISAGEFMAAGRPFISQHSIPHWPAKLKEVTPEAIHAAILDTAGQKVSKEVQEYYRDAYDPTKYHARVMERCAKQWGDKFLVHSA